MMPATMPRVLLAALLGVTTSSALYLYRHAHKPAVSEAMRPVVIVKKPLWAGARLSADALELQQRPARYLPTGTVDQVSAAVGREAKWPLLPGEPLLESRLAQPGDPAEAGLPIPAGRRGVTVAVNEVTGVGGFLRPGSLVDVIATWDVAGVAHSRLILQRLSVLAVSQESQPSDPPKAKVATSVTLAVAPEEAEALVLASERGSIRLAMRPPKENTVATTPGLTPQSLSGEAPVRAAAPRPPHRPHASRPPAKAAPVQVTPAEPPVVVIRGPEGPAEDP